MELVKGQIVTSRKGRDVTEAYVVVGSCKERVLLANGKNRTLAAPKLKNPLHLTATNTVLPKGETDTDLHIKMALKAYNAKRGQDQQGG